jgi:uncharacterized protein YndB with AHSA1/START domain
MGDYEHTATVSADPDALFRYLSDVHHLPDYFSSMQEAEPTGEQPDNAEEGAEEVHVVAEVDGARREGEAWMAVDDAQRTLRWGSEGPNGYHGELQVSPAASGAEVAVRLHTERADGPGIRAGLEQTLASIKQAVEGSSTDQG